MATLGYTAIGGGYEFHAFRVGMTLRNQFEQEVYFQPGDSENALLADIEALDEISEDVTDAKRAAIADIVFGDYFS